MSAPAPPGPPVDPHPEPRSYPLLLRTTSYRWWRPLLGLVLLVVGLFAVQVLLLPLLAVTVAIDHQGSFEDAYTSIATLETVTWQGMLYLNLTLAALVPVAWLVLLLAHRLRPRWLASVRPGFRWGFFWRCGSLAVLALAITLLVGFFLPTDPLALDAPLNDWTGRLAGLALVIALTTPLQAIGEEYAFRGYLLQAFGSLSGRPWFGIVLSSLLFAVAHGAQNAPLFLDRFVFGLMAGYLVFRTGGLEAGIAMHIWNNLFSFGFALALGSIDDSLNVAEISWWNLPLTIVQNGVYLVLVLRLARGAGIAARSRGAAGTAVA